MTDQIPNGRTGDLAARMLAVEQENRNIRNGYGEAVSRAHKHTEQVDRDQRAALEASNRDARAAIEALRVQMDVDDKELHTRIDDELEDRKPRWWEIPLVKWALIVAAVLLFLILSQFKMIDTAALDVWWERLR